MSVRKTVLIVLAALVCAIGIITVASSAFTDDDAAAPVSATETGRNGPKTAAGAPSRPEDAEDAEVPKPPRVIAQGETVLLNRRIGEVRVVNPAPVADESVEISEGGYCEARGWGSLTVVGFDGGRVLVRYRNSIRKFRPDLPGEDDGPYPDCPTGTLFFLSADDFRESTEPPQPSEAAVVKALLEQEKPAEEEKPAKPAKKRPKRKAK